jgi:hypothetical protein
MFAILLLNVSCCAATKLARRYQAGDEFSFVVECCNDVVAWLWAGF